MPKKVEAKIVKAVGVTQDVKEKEIGCLDFWFDYLISVNRPCAIIKRNVFGKPGMRYSVWRTISEDEEEFYSEYRDLDQLEDFSVLREFGNFSEVLNS